MKFPQVSKVVEAQVEATTPDPVTRLTTEWMLAAGATSASILQQLEALGGVGSFKSKAEYRFAAVRTDQPGGWTLSATARDAAGVYTDAVNLSGTTDQLWIQGGIATSCVDGAAEANARLQAMVQGNGMLIGSRTLHVGPIANSGSSVYVEVGRLFPQLGLTKLMVAVVFSGVNGTITWRPVYREVQGDPDAPTSWSNLGSADYTQSTDGNVNTGQLAVSPTTGYLFGQSGIKFSGDARGRMHVTIAGIY